MLFFYHYLMSEYIGTEKGGFLLNLYLIELGKGGLVKNDILQFVTRPRLD